MNANKQINAQRVTRLQQRHRQLQAAKAKYAEAQAALVDARQALANESEGLEPWVVSALVRSGDAK